jgi:hypothetical protein
MHKILFAFIAAFSKWKKKKKKKSVIIPETFEFPRENVRRGAILSGEGNGSFFFLLT